MLTAFGHLEGLGLAETSRNAHDDEYSDDESLASLQPPAKLMWNDVKDKMKTGDTKEQQEESVNVNELFIATELAGSSFLTCNFQSFVQVATLTTEDGALSMSLLASPDDNQEGKGNFQKLLLVGSFTKSGKNKCMVTAGDEWRFIEPLLSGVKAASIIHLDTVLAIKVPLISAAKGRPCAPFVFQLGTNIFVQSGSKIKNGTTTLDAPTLPNPILLEGLGGALMARCEADGINAVSLISLIDRVIDSTALVAYEKYFELNEQLDKNVRRSMYKEAVKSASRQLDSMYL